MGTTYAARSIEQLRAEAEVYGCDVVSADDKLLLLDLDDRTSLERFFTSAAILREHGEFLPPATFWRSKSGEGWHAQIELPYEQGLAQRVLLQALLGSDRTREALAYSRGACGEAEPVVLFRPRGAELFMEWQVEAEDFTFEPAELED